MEITMNDQENLSTERGSPTGNDYLSEILKSIMNSPTADEGAIDRDPTPPPATQATPSADIFSALLSNPELLSKLPSLISSIKPMLDMLGMGSKSIPTSVPVSSAHESSSHGDKDAVEAGAFVKKQSDDRRAALLCAMKPYLSHDRQQAVDYIIKLSRLGDILKTL